MVAATNSNPDGVYDDYDYLRFCRARKFVIVDVWTMFQKMLAWRQENNCDTILEEFVMEEVDMVRTIYPSGYHKVDKNGRPIYIERFGQLDITKLFEITTEERMVKFYV